MHVMDSIYASKTDRNMDLASFCVSNLYLTFSQEKIINSSVQQRSLLHIYKRANITLEPSIATVYFINVGSNNNNEELSKGYTMESNSV